MSVGRQRFTPPPRLSDRIQVVDTVSLFAGKHQLKGGFDFNWIKSRDALPLCFLCSARRGTADNGLCVAYALPAR